MKDSGEYTDLGAVDGDNPDGLIKDGQTDGTLFNKVSWNDLFQFLMYCKRLWVSAGNVVSGSYDNVTNGYQLFEAIRFALVQPAWIEVVTFDGDNTQSDGTIYNKLHYRVVGDSVEITGAFSNNTGNGFTVPVAARPLATQTVSASSSTAPFIFQVATNGNVIIPGGSGVALYIFNVKYTIADLTT